MNDQIKILSEVASEQEKKHNFERFETGIYPLDRALKLREGDKGGLAGGDVLIISAPTGNGKCFSKGTKVLMFDGSVKKIEEIVVGDVVMGDDSTPRVVEATTSGEEEMFDIIPVKGDKYTVNRSHILSLRRTGTGKDTIKGQRVDISVYEYIEKSKTFKHIHKGYRAGVNFTKKELEIEPYILGIWLGDGTHSDNRIESADVEVINEIEKYAQKNGCSVSKYEQKKSKSDSYAIIGLNGWFLKVLRKNSLIKNKHIPLKYKTSSRKQRLELLAGLIDSDGYWNNPSGLYFSNKNEKLIDDVLFLCRSLGFAAYKKKYYNKKYKKHYFKISISGDLSTVPVRCKRKRCNKRRQIKDILNTGITVKSVGVGKYYGFSIVGNKKRFLLGDFTVVHNTEISATISYQMLCKENIKSVWFTYEVNAFNLWERFKKMGASDGDLICVPFQHTTGNLDWIEKKIKEAKENYDTKLAVIDHIGFLTPKQGMSGNMSQNYSAYLGQIVRELKTLAVRENVMIILPVHMVKSANDDPTLRDIGHSGGIAQEADAVVLLAREESVKTRMSGATNEDYYSPYTKVILAKNRIGGKTPSFWMEMINGRLVETIKKNEDTI